MRFLGCFEEIFFGTHWRTTPCSNRDVIDVRDENPSDWKAVYQVVSSAFGQLAEAELVEKLRGGDSVVSLVAEEDGQIVGHVLLSRMGAPFPALALAPVSVIPAKQRSGIGSALVKRAVNLARSEGWAAIFVLGDPNYYERFGFDKEATAGFTSPYAGDHFMVLKLSPLLPTTGELRHAPAFSAFI
jgi:putative acetyltransferase